LPPDSSKKKKLSNVDFAKRKCFEIDCFLTLKQLCQHKWQAHVEIPTHNAITVPKRAAIAETREQLKKTVKNYR